MACARSPGWNAPASANACRRCPCVLPDEHEHDDDAEREHRSRVPSVRAGLTRAHRHSCRRRATVDGLDRAPSASALGRGPGCGDRAAAPRAYGRSRRRGRGCSGVGIATGPGCQRSRPRSRPAGSRPRAPVGSRSGSGISWRRAGCCRAPRRSAGHQHPPRTEA